MSTLSVVSDFVCPWCFIGKARLDAALSQLEAPPTVQYLPFKLNPTMPPEGMARADYRRQKFGSMQHSDALDTQVREAAEDSGVTIRHDLMERTPNTLKAHMVMAMAASVSPDNKGVPLRLADALFSAYFTEGRDISLDEVLLELAETSGVPASVAAAAIKDEELLQATNTLADGLALQGVSGVPTLLLDQHFLVSGAVPSQDLVRLIPEAISTLKKAAQEKATH
ncbi:MAG: DsbA family oxidoreductase [Pseudomonadota bacterium]